MILFCDIDDTLTETISGQTFKQSPTDVKIIEGADKAIAHKASLGWLIVGVSNQGGCDTINRDTGKPLKSFEDAIAEMQFTLKLFPQLKAIYFCPDMKGYKCFRVDDTGAEITDNTEAEAHFYAISRAYDESYSTPLDRNFRKPGAGMIFKISADFKLGVQDSWMVGDRPEDEQAAINAGINFCPADVWRDRFKTGMFTHQVTPEQLRFLEGVKL